MSRQQSRVKFARMKDLIEENERLNTLMCQESYYKHSYFNRMRGYMSQLECMRQDISRVLESIVEQSWARVCERKPPNERFRIGQSKCTGCRGTGGAEKHEDDWTQAEEENERGPLYHDPTQGIEFWCEECDGIGYSMILMKDLPF